LTSDDPFVLLSFVSSHPIPAEPETAAAQHVPYYIRVLHEMIEIGVDLTRLVHQQAKAEVEAVAPRSEPAADFTAAFERMSRTVRRTIMLAHKLAQPVAASAQPGRNREAARKQIIRQVEDAIQRDAPRDRVDSLHAEFLERLDSPDLEDDIDQRPIDEIIADIRRDLGIAAMPGTHPWKRRTPEDVALLCARAAGPSVPPGVVAAAAHWPGDARIRAP
jgi:hypothetical protein